MNAMAAIPAPTLLDEIETFRARYGVSKTRFGEMAAGSSQLVFNLDRGREVGRKLEHRIRAFLAAGDPGTVVNQRQARAAKEKRTKARNQARSRAEADFRMHDMAELAKAFLRQDRIVVFNAEVVDPKALGMFRIGVKTVDRDELLEIARKRGWKGGTGE